MNVCHGMAMLVLLLSGAALSAAPLLDLRLDGNLANAGSVAGGLTLQDYAEGQEALFVPGPWGDCLDTTAASRHGGRALDDPPAGSGLLLDAATGNGLPSLTFSCWFQEVEPSGPAPVRLVFKDGLIDLGPLPTMYSLGTGTGDTKLWYRFPHDRTANRAAWQFVALVLDAKALTARVYTAPLGGPLEALPEVALQAAPVSTPGPLEFLNLRGIRPFRGRLDNLRLWDTALSAEEVGAIHAADAAAARKPRPPLLSDSVLPPGPRRGVFKPSDIGFSTRWQKDEGLATADAFHANRMLWVYGEKAEFIARAKQNGRTYQGTLNGMWASEQGLPQPEHEGDTTGRAYDLDGRKYVPTWMRGWKQKVPNYIGCCNSPGFRALFFKGADALLDAGADMLQIDDWAMNASWVRDAGVCFCEHCEAGFRQYLAEKLPADKQQELALGDLAQFSYANYLNTHDQITTSKEYLAAFNRLPLTPYFEDFQTQSLRRFLQDLSRHMDEKAGKHIPIGVNNQFGDRAGGNGFRHAYAADLYDFQLGEKFREDPETHILACRMGEAMGLWQVLSPMPRKLAPTRAALALTYALGQLYLVPWDIYMGNGPDGLTVPRFMGTREQFGDCYDLIAQQPGLFEGYGSPAVVAVVINLDEPVYAETVALCADLTRRGVPHRLVVAGAKRSRFPLTPEQFQGCRAVVMLSAPETFAAEDQQVLEAVKAGRRLHYLVADERLPESLKRYGLNLLQVEGPEGVYAIPRVKAGGTVIHLVNWNADEQTDTAEEFAHVTVALHEPAVWGEVKAARYYEPGGEPVDLTIERHQQFLRLTVPRLKTWGIIELQ